MKSPGKKAIKYLQSHRKQTIKHLQYHRKEPYNRHKTGCCHSKGTPSLISRTVSVDVKHHVYYSKGKKIKYNPSRSHRKGTIQSYNPILPEVTKRNKPIMPEITGKIRSCLKSQKRNNPIMPEVTEKEKSDPT